MNSNRYKQHNDSDYGQNVDKFGIILGLVINLVARLGILINYSILWTDFQTFIFVMIAFHTFHRTRIFFGESIGTITSLSE
jgi:hypothetical protein